jgi:hypothetical protein
MNGTEKQIKWATSILEVFNNNKQSTLDKLSTQEKLVAKTEKYEAIVNFDLGSLSAHQIIESAKHMTSATNKEFAVGQVFCNLGMMSARYLTCLEQEVEVESLREFWARNEK